MTGKRRWSGRGAAAGNKRSWIMGALMVGLLVLLLPAGALADWTVDGGTQTVTEDIIYRGEFIGWSGEGTVIQNAYTNTAFNYFKLGYYATGRGTYNLSGTGILSARVDEEIGISGFGDFRQSGGINQVSGELKLGLNTNSSGNYDLSGGSLWVVSDETIGYNGTGTFTQSGGTHWVGGTLNLVVFNGSGTYTLTGGSLTAGTIVLSANGIFKQTGGTLQYGAFNQQGGEVQGSLENRGTFTYEAGLFSGRLLNYGQLDLLSTANNFTAGNGLAQYSNTPIALGTGQTLTLNGQGLEVDRGAGFEQTGGSLTANYEYVGNSGVGTFTQSGGANRVTRDFFLGNNSGSSGTYTQSGGSLYVGVGETVYHEYIGYHGTGAFTQSGGSHEVANNLYLGRYDGSSGAYTQSGGTTRVDKYLVAGRYAGSRGAYDLRGGSLSVGDGGAGYDEYIGYSGTGAFTQSGGSHQVTNDLYLGLNADGSGAYTLSGSGSLSAKYEYVGNSGVGAFTQSGGSHNVTNSLYLGRNAGSSGTYDLRGGSLSVGLGGAGYDESIGYSGTGAFTQSGGTHSVGGILKLAASNGSGTYTLYGGSLTAGTIEVKSGGSFNQTGGSLNFTTFDQSGGSASFADLKLGAGSSATYNLGGSGSLSALVESIGASTTGFFNQTGGTHQTSFLTVGEASGVNGTYNLSNGSLSADHDVTVGKSGSGTFTQTGGSSSHTIGGNLILADNTNSRGTYNLEGGTLSAANELIGFSGTGIFTQSGGINKVENLVISAGIASGTYNLAGGTLEAAKLQVNRYGSFNVTGGTQTVTGDVTAVGAIHTTNADVTWKGTVTLTDGGEYHSDPSTQTFDNLIVESEGCIMADLSYQDTYIIRNNFQNQSTQRASWNTTQAILNFITGPDAAHDLYIPGTDQGATSAGYINNFAWSTLDLTGQTVNLFDGTGTNGGALYVEAITGVDFAGLTVNNIVGSNTVVLNIYYDPNDPLNGYLNADTYAFAIGQGHLIPTPVPASVLLFGSGLLGLGLLGRRRKKKN
jgi:hypothetical protein